MFRRGTARRIRDHRRQLMARNLVRGLEPLEARVVLAASITDLPVGDVDPSQVAFTYVAQASEAGSSSGELNFSGERGDYVEIPHQDAFELSEGTVALSFTADDVTGRHALYSKDARNYKTGGHLTAFVRDRYVEVRLQSTDRSVTLRTAWGSVQAGEPHHLAVTFGEKGFRVFLDGKLEAWDPEFMGGIETNTENLLIGANGWARDSRNPDWAADFFKGTIKDFTIYNRALNRAEVTAISSIGPADDGPTAGTTGTGLDKLVDIILDDPGLNRRVDPAEIQEAAGAADAMNHIIVEAVKETGLGNDGEINSADMYDLNSYIQGKYLERWVVLHGDDEEQEETGFHLVQNDGAITRLFGGYNAVNTVADGLFHMGFDIERGRFLNEDGNRNVSVETAAYWLDEFLEKDLAKGDLNNPGVDPYAEGTTGTGLDLLVEIITVDPGLNRRIPTSEITTAALAADEMNHIIVKAIRDTGLANDGVINAADVRDFNTYIRENYGERWVVLHGDDEESAETGFHLVQNDGATTYLFGRHNAVNTIADGIFHLGFDIQGYRLLNEDGNANASVQAVAYWLDSLLNQDLADGSLSNPTMDPYAEGTTGTGLDQLVDMITTDPGLNAKVATSEITTAALAANEMNHIIVEAIKETGLANDGTLNSADIRDINAYIQSKYQAKWVLLHGDDEGDEETGFHLVQNDGATTRLFSTNGVNTVADGIFHLGFNIVGNRLLNEDGNKNASVETVSHWLSDLLHQELADGSLKNDTVDPYAEGTTGTGLDLLVDIITDDPGLNYWVPTSEITTAAIAADEMNQIIVEAIKETGLANDGTLNSADVRDVNAYIQTKYQARWVVLHGDDEGDEETGFHLVQNDGATTRLSSTNTVNTVADGIFHLGFNIVRDRLLNEDGNRNASVETVSHWLTDLLRDDLTDGSLKNDKVDPYAEGTTGTGLDHLVEIITSDPGLNYRVPTSEITTAAKAADEMSHIIIAAIKATGAANDGEIDKTDMVDVNAHIQANYEAKWVELHGDDEETEETGFHLVQNDGATTHLFGGYNAVNTVADGVFHVGFDIERDQFLNEDGNRNVSVRTAAHWISELLDDELESGVLANPDLDPDPAAIADAQVFSVDRLVMEEPSDYMEVEHVSAFELANGTFALRFVADDVSGRHALFSKDARGYVDGGHLTAFVRDGRIEVRLQNTEKSVSLWTQSGSVQAGDAHHLAVTFGADGFRVYLDGKLAAARTEFTTGIDTNTENLAIGANIWARDSRYPKWTANHFDGTIEDFKLYNRALNRAEIWSIGGVTDDGSTAGTTGTGLDQLVDIILKDPGLNRRVDPAEIAEAAEAADKMNHIIVEAIEETGLANNGTINAADVRDINAYIQANHAQQWIVLHGDDGATEETGFHLVQNDGATSYLFGGNNAVNTVADGIFHLGFDIEGDRLLNEDGNRNASVETVAYWLDALLEDQLEDGSLANTTQTPYAEASTGTGLDLLIEIITSDPGLNRRVATSEITTAALAADSMNGIIIKAIKETGLANDGTINAADVYDINAYIQANYETQWVVLHGDDEGDEETGFHLVQNDGATTRLYATNAVNTVADGVYHLGFDIVCGRLLNEDGNKNASVETAAHWLSDLLHEDLADGSLSNPDADPYAVGSTGTGLDQLVNVITSDPGLNYRVATSEIITAANAANDMNQIIVKAIKETGLANDGTINSADVRDINAYIQGHYQQEWIALHGDDEGDEETGFHLVQNDGATTRLYANNAVNTVADGVYHLGFDIVCSRLLNEDGNKNASVETVAHWLTDLLRDDLADGSLSNDKVDPYAEGTTGTGLDQLIGVITSDPGLNYRVATSEITTAAIAADDMNHIIIGAVKATGVANDGTINAADVRDINAYIQANHEKEWIALHGDDEGDEETGFHLVQNDGATTDIFGGSNAVNTVADGIYHLGFDIVCDRLLNEDGNKNASVATVANWLSELLREDLADGSLSNPKVEAYAEGTTGTGLDQLVDVITDDPGLNQEVATHEITTAATAADDMNHIIIGAIKATGAANDGVIDTIDMVQINAHIQANHEAEWTELHGDDEDCEETGFHLVQNDGATTRMFGGNNAVNTVADGVYHIGFDIQRGRFLNEDGDRNVSVATAAHWLNQLLQEDLESGKLVNPHLEPDLDAIAGAVVFTLGQQGGAQSPALVGAAGNTSAAAIAVNANDADQVFAQIGK